MLGWGCYGEIIDGFLPYEGLIRRREFENGGENFQTKEKW